MTDDKQPQKAPHPQGKQPIRTETMDPDSRTGARGRPDGDVTQGDEGVDAPSPEQAIEPPSRG